jgi:tRNA-splicing ligase RtcB
MEKVISGGRVPIKMWLKNVEESALVQAQNLADLPFAFKHIALMPDCHAGYGMPIGGVLATVDAISPNCVGVDIACGMRAVKTDIVALDKRDLKDIMSLIRQMIPVGFNSHDKPQSGMPALVHQSKIISDGYAKAERQLGTLGGGNHFIEIQKGSDGHYWLMVHSGSRKLGHSVGTHHNKVAVELNEMWYSSVPKAHQLAFLPKGTLEYVDYWNDMTYCVLYAKANRRAMMARMRDAVDMVVGAEFGEEYDVAHNYAALENHFGKNVLVHRKGATRAYDGEIGIIPGSQGTKSYIVRGRGNEQSFKSCSHGAGRQMSRSAARKELDLAEEVRKLDEQGILHSIRSVGDLDEAAGAYKDIADVMAYQADLVDIEVELTPVAVVKG